MLKLWARAVELYKHFSESFMQLHYEKKLKEYLADCEARNVPVNLGYVRYLKGRIEREKEAQNSFLKKLIGF